MDYEETKKAYRQIETWRKEIAKDKQDHVNNITDKSILLELARKQVKNLGVIGDVSSNDLSKINEWITEENKKVSDAISKRQESLEMAAHGAICAYKKVKELLSGC